MTVPCSSTDPGALKISMLQLEPRSLLCPPVSLSDFTASLERVKPSVSADECARHERWAAQFGGVRGGDPSEAEERAAAAHDARRYREEDKARKWENAKALPSKLFSRFARLFVPRAPRSRVRRRATEAKVAVPIDV
jgi:hypothetical protein